MATPLPHHWEDGSGTHSLGPGGAGQHSGEKDGAWCTWVRGSAAGGRVGLQRPRPCGDCARQVGTSSWALQEAEKNHLPRKDSDIGGHRHFISFLQLIKLRAREKWANMWNAAREPG